MKQKYIILLALCSLLFGFAGFWAGTNYSASTMTDVEEVEKVEDQRLQVGDSVTINGVFLTVNDVKLDRTNEEYDYVIVDLSITNQKEHIHEFTLYKLTLVDEEGYAYEHDHQYDTKGILGGQIAPQRTVRGEVAFFVPSNEKYEFIYTDHLRTGQVIWYVDSSSMKIVKREKE
ncbi:hypothetical protein BTR23_07780 [Alkalihalophilus pseudofirmus]|nr:hypothetical protein BTR23_07780 [Alkalihalophilus pseudofirmus]